MNLLVKKLKVPGAVLVVLLFFVSCEDPGKIGLNIDPKNSSLQTKYKEFVLPSTQVQFNPRTTVNSNSFQAGSYTDVDFGKITSKSYTWLGIQPSVPVLSQSAAYTGTTLSIQFVSIYGAEAENNKIESFELYQLKNPLELGVDYTRLDDVELGSLLGNIDLVIQENDTLQVDSTYQFNLSDEFGMLVFDKMVNNDPIFENDTTFNAFMNGVAIVPTAGNNKIVQFNTGSFRINVNYTEVNSAGEIVKRSYLMDLGALNYYHLNSDLSGTALSGIMPNNQDFMPSSDYRYMQAGTMIALKIDMDSVYTFFKEELSDTVNSVIIQRAALSIGDIGINKTGALEPFSLVGYFTDDTNIWPAFSKSSDGTDSLFVTLQGEVTAQGAPNYPGYYGNEQDIFLGQEDTLKYSATMSNFIQNLALDRYNTGDTPLEQGGQLFIFAPTSPTLPQSAPSHSKTNFFKVHKDDIKLAIYYSTSNF